MPLSSKETFKKFLKWKYRNISNKQFINISSAIIGLLAGLGAVTLKNTTHFIQHVLEGAILKEIHENLYFIFPVIGLFFVLIFIKYIVKKKVGHGIPSTLFAISKLKGIMPKHQIWASVISAPLTVGFGGSVGLEGPTVATGAALGSNFARLFHLNQTTRNLLIGAAASGAMSAIFKAPIAAIVFAVEIFSLELTLASMIPLLLASITAILTSYFFLGDDVLLHFTLDDKFLLKDVLFYVFLGVFTSLVSVYFSKVYFAISDFFRKIASPYKRLLIGGILLGGIVYLIPPLFGEGYETINRILRGNIVAVVNDNFFNIVDANTLVIGLFLLGLILFKIIATSLTFGAGGIGGVFAPTLFTGSLTGSLFAFLMNHFFGYDLSLINFAMVGMAGLMSGVLLAPLTAIFLIAEITGGYELFIPLMIVASISFMITKRYIPHNIYAAQLAKKGELITHDKNKNILMFLDINRIIETNFSVITSNMNLGEIVNTAVIQSKRNIFPVIKAKTKELAGIVLLDDIRSIMFDQDLYGEVRARDVMHAPPEIIDIDLDKMTDIMKKFQDSSAWNLPVVKDGVYIGFISKSKLLTAYRNKLIEVSS